MKTTDLFANNRSAKKINESLEKTFGKKLNLESFNLEQLQDARNKLRTQIHDARSQSGFNENIENEALTQAQWMLDAINAEIAEREEFVVDAGPAEVEEDSDDPSISDMSDEELADYIGADTDWVQGHREEAEDIAADMNSDYGAGETDDDYALASAGFGSDEDYGHYGDEYEDAVKKVDVPAYQRKASGDKDWKVTQQDLEKDKERSATTLQGMEKRKRELGVESAPPGAKAERMVKHIKKGYAKDGKLTDKEKSIAYATAWKQHNKEKNESTESGEDMTKLQEGEIQQASAIVTAKTMVDRVGRWIEELSGMENDTLLQLGDSIRDEMGSEQAKNFISAVAPAIQAALENLKTTRETLATGVRTLTGEEQGAEMLGAEPEGDMGDDELGAAEPDEMNMPAEEPAADEFAAAEPAAGGLGDAGREQRESIDYQNRLLKVLAG